MSNKPRR